MNFEWITPCAVEVLIFVFDCMCHICRLLIMAVASPRDFFDLVKAIGESKSKQEEDRIISEEVAYLKKIMPQNTNSKKKIKELIIRSLYVEMLGLDASFAYIRAVELCASTNIAQKRVGYLACEFDVVICFANDIIRLLMLICCVVSRVVPVSGA
jgi:hypothetical protein